MFQNNFSNIGQADARPAGAGGEQRFEQPGLLLRRLLPPAAKAGSHFGHVDPIGGGTGNQTNPFSSPYQQEKRVRVE